MDSYFNYNKKLHSPKFKKLRKRKMIMIILIMVSMAAVGYYIHKKYGFSKFLSNINNTLKF